MIARLVARYLASGLARGAALVVLVLGALVQIVGVPGVQDLPPYRIDFDVYRTGGRVFLDGGPLYGELPALMRGDHLPFTYPPISAELFSVFTLAPLAVGSVLITLLTLAALAYVVYVVLRSAIDRPRRELLWLTVLVMAVGIWSGPVRETIGFGQVNVLLMGLVVLGCVGGRGRWWGGLPVGLAAAVKLTPAVFILYFLLRKDWRGAAMTVLGAVGVTALGHLLAPDDSVRYWTFALRDPARIGSPAFASNQSINGVLYRLGLEAPSVTVVWFGLSCVAGLACVAVAWRLLGGGHDVAAVVAISLVALFCSPVSWGHHWVWGVPMVVLALVWAVRGAGGARAWAWVAGVGAVILLVTPQWWFPHGDDTEYAWGPVAHVVGDAFLIWAVWFLALLGVRADRLGAPDRVALAAERVGVDRA